MQTGLTKPPFKLPELFQTQPKAVGRPTKNDTMVPAPKPGQIRSTREHTIFGYERLRDQRRPKVPKMSTQEEGEKYSGVRNTHNTTN